MTITFVNDLRLSEMATGDNSGTWGNVTNTNLELIGEALGYGTEGITTNANTHTSTIADGSTDPVRALYVEYTGTLDSACTITIAPNTVNKVCFIENGTSGSQNIIIKQGSGATITIPPGDTKAVYLDGAGSGAKVVDAFASLSVVDLKVQDDLTVTDDAAIGGTALVTGVLTTTAATVFNGGFASNDGSTISTADNTDTLTLISTDADAAVGPNLILYRNSASPEDDNQLGKIKFTGRNDNSQDVNYAQFVNQIKDASDGAESARFALFSMVGGTDTSRLEALPAETVFNESQADIDFRVESDGNAHMLFVDAGNNHVNIGIDSDRGGVLNVYGTGTPIAVIESEADGTVLSLRCTDSDANAGPNLELFRNATGANSDNLGSILFKGTDSSANTITYASIGTQISDASSEGSTVFIQSQVAGTLRERITIAKSSIVINQESLDLDFRVESANNTACLFVDGAEDRVGINEDVPLEELHISGNGNDSATIALQRLQAGLSTQSRGAIVSFNSATKAMCGISFNAGGDNDNGDIQFYATNDNTSSASLFDLDRLVVFGATGTVFNEDSGNKDFRIESDGNTHGLFLDASNGIVCIGTNDLSVAGNTGSASGINLDGGGVIEAAAYQKTVAYFNRMNNDGVVVEIRQNGAIEGTISVSGNTVSYNGFSGRHESSGIPANTPVGTVVSTIDTLDVYPDNATDTKGNAISHPKAGQIRADHAQVEVSTSEGDACVYGVVSEFDTDGKLIVTSVGIGSVRVTGACAKGDLLESNGDGTAKVQSDDIVRSKTLGKVTIGNSNTGVKLVACVMYCG